MNKLIHVENRMASVIIPCLNQLEETQNCIASLFRHTRPSWELIAVDNGSRDGTANYFQGVRDAAAYRVEIVTNAENRGFPAACNQGLALAQGNYLVLLNNDAVVTDAWLDMLIALADSNPTIGMVGPMSNYAAPPQLVEAVTYDSLDAMHRFASRWRLEHRGQWFLVPKLSGFCLLIKRAAYETVGGLDERFGLGLYDDQDLALRMRRAGYELAVARDLFVHHHGSRTFVGANIDAEALLLQNQARFTAKWRAAAVPTGQTVALTTWVARQEDPASALPERPKVSLTMIVRDEEANLPACLSSVRGLFDEIIVVDTGSKDRTVEIARSFGARVFDFVWVDDFAAARNAALARASGDYAFWLDADDLIEPTERTKLQALLDRLGQSPGAHVIRCACDPDTSGGTTVVDHVRLFPIREDVRWDYRVHEQILPALRRAQVEVHWSGVTVRHTGYANRAVRLRKLDRDWRILNAELSDRSEDPFIHFNLGCIALEREDPWVALTHLRRSLSGSAPADSITRKLYALIARAHQTLSEPEAALAACAAGLELEPDDAELLFRQGILYRQRGDSARAAACWERVLTLRRPEKFSSVDSGIYGHLTRRNLAAVLEEQGDQASAARLWAAVLVECPGDSAATAARARLARECSGGEAMPEGASQIPGGAMP